MQLFLIILDWLDTFTDRKGPAYEKWRYASDYVMKNHGGKMTDQEMIAHIEKKFNKKKVMFNSEQ